MIAGRTRLIASVGLVVLAIIWILQNGGSVQTKFLFITVTMPQSALLAITMLVGVAVGMLVAVHQSGKLRRQDKDSGSGKV